MSQVTFNSLFSHTHAFLPVIHVRDMDQVLANARIAHEEGADGVFLINHNILEVRTLSLIEQMRKIQFEFPDFPVGLNCLDLTSTEAVSVIPEDTPMLWCDDGGIYGHRTFPDAAAKRFANERAARGWNGLYFGGVAFKGQKESLRPQEDARIAIGLIDVITTSGYVTGDPPALSKVQDIRKGCGDTPLAIASGMTPENVRSYLPYARAFLVATGISKDEHEFDRARVRAFREAMRS